MYIPGSLNLRRADPDQLDRTLRIVTPISLITLAALLMVVCGAVLWAAIATVPVKVMANGLLMPARGIVEIPAPSSGPLVELPVRVGDLVAPGDIIGRIDHPALAARLDGFRHRLNGLRNDQQRLTLLIQEQRAVRERTSEARLAALGRQLADIDRRKAALTALLNKQTSQSAGGSGGSGWLDMEGQLALLRHERTEVEDNLERVDMERQEQAVADARELARGDQEIAALERDLNANQSELDGQALIRATMAGRVVELSASVGDIVTIGTPLLRLLPVSAATSQPPADDDSEAIKDDELIALLYASPAEGKRIRPGMMAQIVPSTARIEREGFIYGEVIAVSAIPSSREGMQRQLKNTALVDQLMAEGPPFELRVRMLPDHQSPSGYHWSTGNGPALAVESGTSASGSIVVDRMRAITLLLPRFGQPVPPMAGQ